MNHMNRGTLIFILVVLVSICTWVLGTILAALMIDPWMGDGKGEGFLSVIKYWWYEPGYWLNIGILVPLMVGSQALFLLPLVPMRLTPGKPSSLKGSILVAAFGAGMLTLCLAMGVFSLVQLIGGWINSKSLGMFPFVGPHGAAFLDEDAWSAIEFLIPAAFLVVSWMIWCIPISRFLKRGQPLTRFSRLTGLLLAGTVLEVVLLLPLEAMVRRRSDCYCGSGSFQGLFGGLVAALWLAGPGIFLLLANRHPAWWKNHCQRCGYEKARGSSSSCSECGWDWSDG